VQSPLHRHRVGGGESGRRSLAVSRHSTDAGSVEVGA
jgi:hypothetical protein